MSEFRKNRELPYQSYQRIKKNVLSSKKNGGISGVTEKDLFIDPSFPPDKTSLTYVYSGDDRYEKMVFKRPPAITKNAVFVGVGGCWDATFPWKQFRKRRWFEAAVVVLSLSVKYLEKVINGYRNCEQNYSSSDYIGAFIFNIWRFGEFVEAIVDDNLPVLDNKLLYCPAHGNPPEYWGALLHKAYAKIMKTYEAIECGNMLDAMTDLTGAICEFFNPDVNPPENIFHLLYKSSVNRSLMVCWRNEKRLTPSGFHCRNYQDDGDETHTYPDDKRYLHIITATTKFPTTDGRMIEMVRLKCPFYKEPKWNGKYSDCDVVSWRSLNSDFKNKYRPFTNKEEDEYWMTLEDFRCNFGGLVICSQTDPYKPDGFNVERMYIRKKTTDFDYTGPNKDVHPMPSSRRIRYFRGRRHSSTPNCYGPGMFRSRGIEKEEKKREIKVRECEKTVKFDSTYQNPIDSNISTSNNLYGRRYSVHTSSSENSNSNDVLHLLLNRKKSYDGSSADWRYSDGSWNEKQTPNSAQYSCTDALCQNTNFTENRDRLSSGNSNLSDTGSAFSTSDISVHVFSNNSSEDLLRKTHSAPVTSSVFRRTSLSSTVSQFSQNNFFATKTDFFSSHGAWKEIITHKGCWTSQSAHSSYPRILIHLSKSDAVNEITPPSCHGKCHVIFSLLQDCRNGPKTTNSLLVQIGFCIYKCKNPERDEKRPLSKLSLIGQIESRGDTREVTSRFDLDKGSYFVVPYCLSKGHEGEFLLRVIGEKDPVANKTGCCVS